VVVEHGNGLGDVGHAEIRHKVEEGFRGFATLIHTVDCSLTGASGGFGFSLATPGNRATRADHNMTKQRADRGHVDEFFDVFAWMGCVLGAPIRISVAYGQRGWLGFVNPAGEVLGEFPPLSEPKAVITSAGQTGRDTFTGPAQTGRGGSRIPIGRGGC
jgi:hypothetical protein